MATYRELLAKENPDMQTRVVERIEQASIKIALSQQLAAPCERFPPTDDYSDPSFAAG